jgi:hypothetical protein
MWALTSEFTRSFFPAVWGRLGWFIPSDINLLLEFWPAGLAQAGADWEELVEMLQRLNMNLTLVRTHDLVPFDAHDVRSNVSWNENVFAHRTRSHR